MQAKRREQLAALAELAARDELLPAAGLQDTARRLEHAFTHGETETARLLLAALVKRIDIKPDGSPHVTLRRPTISG